MSDTIQSSLVIERSYKAEAGELWALWTTKDGFESWWGPQGFRADVHEIEARPGGRLHYDMVADSAEMIAAMKEMGAPTSHPCRGSFTVFEPHATLELTQRIDFLPGVEPYDSVIRVDFLPVADGKVRMIVTLSQMHDAETTGMQREGFGSQLTKLDQRYGWQG